MQVGRGLQQNGTLGAPLQRLKAACAKHPVQLTQTADEEGVGVKGQGFRERQGWEQWARQAQHLAAVSAKHPSQLTLNAGEQEGCGEGV
jgi:hypothetical protein